MKSRLLRLGLFAACVGAAIASAQNQPPAPTITEEAQKFLNAPAWYLNYTVTIRLNGTQGSRTDSRLRVVTGTLQLGLRSQGPSLSVVSGEAKPPDLTSQLAAQQARALAALGPNATLEAMAAAATASLAAVNSTQVDQARSQLDAFVNNYANWISGVNIDESKSDQENERMLIQVREQNGRARENYRWEYTAAGSAEGRNEGFANGSGVISYQGEPAFEIDGAKRKFKLMFQLAFNDSIQTHDALRGVEQRNIGTIHYQRFEIKTGLHSGEQAITETTPVYNVIQGTLPQSFGSISGQSVHSIVQDRIPGTLSVQYVLSPNPPEPVELIIEPPANYDRWQPIAKNDEKTAGDVVPIKVVLQKPGGGTPRSKPIRFNFFLKNTTREAGICLNWPPPPAVSSSAANEPPPFDLQFEPDKNPNLTVMGNDGQAAVDNLATPAFTSEVIVSSFDYGAYGELEASAELENGQTVFGVVKFTTDQQQLKLPLCKDGSKIALAFLENLSHLPDDDDSDADPIGDRFTGDGLTLYEEYRGFMIGDKWMPANPRKKEVFVINELRGLPSVSQGIRLFERVTGLTVYDLLLDNQVQANGQINYRRTAGAHLVDQHAIRIEPGELVALGNTIARVTGKVGTPGTAKTVSVPPDLGLQRSAQYMAATLAHEMLHACNVYHHGEKDMHVWWSYQPPGNQFYESTVGFDPVQQANVGMGMAIPITVKNEDGSVVIPSRFFPAGKTGGPVYLGLPHGLHSGAENCMMRYDTSLAFVAKRDPYLRYFSGQEPTGLTLCSSPAGTGINAANRSDPESRYLSAATTQNGGPEVKGNRGDCLHQLRVSDLATEPQR